LNPVPAARLTVAQDLSINIRIEGTNIRLAGRPQVFKIFISIVCLCFWASPAIASANPEEVIKRGTDQVLEILNENPENTQTRREKIREVVDEYFDFEGIARCVLGPQWDNQPPEKQQEFTRDFSKLLINTIGDIGNYADGKITYNQKEVGEDHAVVEALISRKWASQVGVEYYLYLKNGNWKVDDVAIRGVSLVSNYRCQFAVILSRNSFDDLLKQLEKKIAQG
jgi:phospholipid transport system substrate-binding protein